MTCHDSWISTRISSCPPRPSRRSARTPVTAPPTSSACARSSCTTTPTARCTACWTGPTRTPSASTTPRSASRAQTCTRSTASPDRRPYRPGPGRYGAGVMKTTTLGRGGPVVSRVGLGLMGMSGIYGQADDHESIATIRAGIDAGITLLDTGDFYGMGHNELLLRDALRGIPRDSVFIQVKFGGQRDPSGAFIGHDASPVGLKNSLAYTLTRLGTDYVDLYQPARLDPRVPIEDTVGAIAEMIQAGYVRHIGLSEVVAQTIRRAHAVHPIAALQIEYSLMSRGIEAEILPTVRELGISVTAYGILSRGLLSSGTARLAPGDPRTRFPRFSGENHARNLELLAALETIAEKKGEGEVGGV